MPSKMIHTPIKLREDFGRYGYVGGMGLEVIPELRDENEFFGRRKLLHIWKFLKNHAANLAASPVFSNQSVYSDP